MILEIEEVVYHHISFPTIFVINFCEVRQGKKKGCLKITVATVEFDEKDTCTLELIMALFPLAVFVLYFCHELLSRHFRIGDKINSIFFFQGK